MFEIVSLFGLMVSALLIVNTSPENKLSIYLSLFFLTVSIFSLTRNFVFYTNHPYILYYFVPGGLPLFNLSAPLLYLYIKKSMLPDQPENLTKSEYWHLLPFAIALLNIMPHVFLSSDVKIEFIRAIIQNPFKMLQLKTLLFPIEYNIFLRPFIGFIYSVAAFRIFMSQRVNFLNHERNTVPSNLNWYLLLIVCAGLNFLTSFLIGLFAQHGAYRVTDVNEVKLFMLIPTLFLIVMNSAIFFFPRILYSVYKKKPIKKEYSPEKLEFSDQISSSVRTMVPDTMDSQSTHVLISRKLADYFQNKPFLQPGFTLSVITQDTNIPYHQLTTYYNNYLGINFNDWKNNARIDYAMELINDGRAKNLTLESIAYTCGFLSRSNFVNSFRKKTGMTPSEYLKSVSHQHQSHEDSGLVIKLGFS
jgi:AraC-like DNA-binding protein